MNKLEMARAYEKERFQNINGAERPLFHVTPAAGWMNDPNGFSVYRGEYHIFYQYYPYDVKWGPMHWGHYKSKDLLHWEMLPAALAPDEDYESGCFSGSAVETPDGRHLLMYTAHLEEETQPFGKRITQRQCVAFGDGANYRKYEGNPVLDISDLPEGFSPQDFRDPKIWREEDVYYAVAVSRRADVSHGAVLLFTSKDALRWSFVKTLVQNDGEYGSMWECPDFFEIDGGAALIVSPMYMKKQGLEFHAGQGVVAMLGSYERAAHEFAVKSAQAVDYGLDFYAPQTLLAPDGRRILIGWMQSWASSGCPAEGSQWFGMLTLPRELSVRDGRLVQNPVRELESLRRGRTEHKNAAIAEKAELEGVCGRTIDMTVITDVSACHSFTISLAADDTHKTVIRYNCDSDIISVDRRDSGCRQDILNFRQMPVRKKDGVLKLRFILDRYSMELFVNDGEQAFSACLYETPQEADRIFFEADGKALADVVKYGLVMETPANP